jgi:cysteine desulfurase
MLPFFGEHFGNPSSKAHSFGWAAEAAVEEGIGHLAQLLGVDPERLIATSGATESVNQALKGLAAAKGEHKRHVVTVVTEHKAVLDTCGWLDRQGFDITVLPVDRQGHVDLQELEDSVRADTLAVAVMWANNEIGTIAPIETVSAIARNAGVFLVVDATQAIGKVEVPARLADLLACSAHKFYGPKGVGALYVGPNADRAVQSLIQGGGQQDGRRGGTLNVPGIVGMGEAARIAKQELLEDGRRLSVLRDQLEADILQALPGTRINGDTEHRLPQTSNLTLPVHRRKSILAELRTVAASAGSACQSGSGKRSHVLRAIGVTDTEARVTLRLSLGRPTTAEEVTFAVESIVAATSRMEATRV